MHNNTPARIHVIAALTASFAALLIRAWLQIGLQETGIQRQYAADLSFLLVLPILAILLFPVLKANRIGLRERLNMSILDGRLIFSALALGALLRLGWWCHVVISVALGIYHNNDPNLISGPAFKFQCPPGHVLATGFIVMALLVPLIEEIIHRGLVQSYLQRFGPVVAISGSAAAFTVFHAPGTWGFVFVAGVVLGAQYWITRSLWPSLITHATINALVQLDWRCLQGQWNPPASELPYASVAAAAMTLLVVCGVIIVVLVRQMHRGELSPR